MMQAADGMKLHFLVYNPSRELCRVAMPLTAVDNLADLFPDEDRRIVEAAGVDLKAVVGRARETGYAAQTLIDTHTGARSYRIWIE